MFPTNLRAAKRFAGLSAIVLLLNCAGLARAAGHQSGFAQGDWPFQPLKRPATPQVRESSWIKNPVDAFILARLEKKGLRPSPAADKLTLLRRVSFDLTGLPPTAEEQAAFVADLSPEAYSKVVDRLLASPRYGERWAEHWLDVVRFAETDGFKSDALRPEAYKYRDYVISSLNADLPYDRFVRQQLAGDELEPGNPQAIIATGLNRLYPDEINASDLRQRRQEMLDDLTEVTGSAFLGLTIGCARCHDHKFDPITQFDYYRLQAIFAPIAPRDDLVAATPIQQGRYRIQLEAWRQATKEIRDQIEALVGPTKATLVRDATEGFDADTQHALNEPPEHRSPLETQLVIQADKWLELRLQKLDNRLDDKQKDRLASLQQKLAAFDAVKPIPLPAAMAVVDVGRRAPATYRLSTGDFRKPLDEVSPGFPEFLGLSEPLIPHGVSPDTTGRRAALAVWLSRPDHPMTARVIVNRLWSHHFGAGIVGTPNDFGTMGDAATHTELLDWLAAELVEQKYSLKTIHRLMVTSATYCQTSLIEDTNQTQTAAQSADPNDRLLWRFRGARLEGEAIRDAILQSAGDLNIKMFGPSARPKLPEGIGRYAWEPDPLRQDRDRRSVYVLAKRNLRYPLLEVFDQPDMHNSCPRRDSTVTPPQALELLNSDFTEEEARQWARRLVARYGADKAALVRNAYRTAYGRQPTDEELAAASEFISAESSTVERDAKNHRAFRNVSASATDLKQTATAVKTDSALPKSPPSSVSQKPVEPSPTPASSGAADSESLPPEAEAIADFCHALFNSNEFLYVD